MKNHQHIARAGLLRAWARGLMLASAGVLASCETPAPRPAPVAASEGSAPSPAVRAPKAEITAPPSKPAAPIVAAAWKSASSLTSAAGTYRVHYEPVPAPIPKGGTFALRVWVTRASNPDELARDVTLFVDARMPEHLHGMSRIPACTQAADGSFEVTGMSFHMPGWWQLSFDVTHGAFSERAETRVDLE